MRSCLVFPFGLGSLCPFLLFLVFFLLIVLHLFLILLLNLIFLLFLLFQIEWILLISLPLVHVEQLVPEPADLLVGVVQLYLQLVVLLHHVRDLLRARCRHVHSQLQQLIPQLIVLMHVLLEDLLDLEPLPLLVLHKELLPVELVLELRDLLLVLLALLPLLQLRLESQLLLQ